MNTLKLFPHVVQCFGELKWLGVNLHYYCCEKAVADGISIFMGTLPCSNAKTIGLRIQPGMSKPLSEWAAAVGSQRLLGCASHH